MTVTLAHWYSSESTQCELSNEYQHDKVLRVFKNLCALVLWTKVASALEGLSRGFLYFFLLEWMVTWHTIPVRFIRSIDWHISHCISPSFTVIYQQCVLNHIIVNWSCFSCTQSASGIDNTALLAILAINTNATTGAVGVWSTLYLFNTPTTLIDTQ